MKIKKKGALRKRLKTPKGKIIKVGTLKRDLKTAKRSGNKAHVKQDVFALNARKWKHKK